MWKLNFIINVHWVAITIVEVDGGARFVVCNYYFQKIQWRFVVLCIKYVGIFFIYI